jgi:hypothetical protein
MLLTDFEIFVLVLMLQVSLVRPYCTEDILTGVC